MEHIQLIGFDADDTLWVNEPYFQETENHFCELLSGFADTEKISKELYSVEMQNLPIYGYGVKGFILSMTETAIRISDGRVDNQTLKAIMDAGKQLLSMPVSLIDGVGEVLETLSGKYTLILATKGDLIDQQRKLNNSGLASYFQHIEIMSHKGEAEYTRLLAHLHTEPEKFLMVGNSLKSDILPVLNLGGYGIHIPYHTTWQHEIVEEFYHDKLVNVSSISEITNIIPN